MFVCFILSINFLLCSSTLPSFLLSISICSFFVPFILFTISFHYSLFHSYVLILLSYLISCSFPSVLLSLILISFILFFHSILPRLFFFTPYILPRFTLHFLFPSFFYMSSFLPSFLSFCLPNSSSIYALP